MVFSSLEFIFIFLPAFMAVYALTPSRYKNAILFLGSIIFYSMGVLNNPIYIMLFLLTILFNFIIGEFIYYKRRSAKAWLTLGIIFNFWWLVFFKYSGFFLTNANALLRTHMTVKDIILPIGISFYTFQNVSYIIDVYRRKTRSEQSLVNYGAYISMFPQLIAGPIVTYGTVAEQLKKRQHTPRKIENGLKTFTIGLGYKVLIANQLGGLWRDVANIGYESISSKLAWMGIIAYSFQLYFDFMGYSYMAMGLGQMMAFDIPKNFDYPYLSVTMTEFWRRWHITLGSWFRENIYIPLGGNRKGTQKTVRNFLIVWLFTGLWHGASWNFVLWGLVLFGLIMLERFVIGDFLNKYRIVGHLYMFLVIPLTWLLFAITDFHELGIYFRRLLPFLPQKTYAVMADDYVKYWGIYRKFFIAGIVFSTRIPEMIYKKIKGSPFCAILLLAVFWGCVYCMYKGMNDPFLYFRF
ncbi:MBOAT family protein [Ruminococcus sp. XPD3002]|uniref:MBOAT family O-acyltransferase n=1 Tax=Ruminococcus sp. XPD3002 TaxID=1452269 RepID=UPI000919465C|nr:MBOAT family protein [Ruminococcus sp.]SFX32176.1 alginate O-acetyltransferase complex protein AlgI [Ruminococcus flavefaciens]HRU97535.1 MBOAT family O-acyltransferase [Ruminococcus sp.]